jgi:CelD/BcsL family acetyltransferase involved in cellulose biosynthesis
MHARVVSLAQIEPADERAWRRLAARAIEPNPFYEPDFLLPACCRLRHGRHAGLMAVEEAGRFHAVLPVPWAALPAVPLPVVTSWRHLYGYLGTPLLAPEQPAEAARCLLTALRGRAAWPGVMVLELVGDDGPAAASLRDAAAWLGLTVQVHARAERAVFRADEESDGGLPANIRRERRAKARQWRRLCAEGGDPAVVDRSEDMAAAAEFLRVEASGWKGRAGTALASRRQDATFYREVAERFRASGRLRLYALEQGGATLAMQTSLCADHAVFDWKAAYDERFAGYGPGAQLQLRVLQLERGRGAGWIDSCADPSDGHQSRLVPGRRSIATLAIGPGGAAGHLVLSLAVALVELSGKLRGLSLRTLRYQLEGSARTLRRRRAGTVPRRRTGAPLPEQAVRPGDGRTAGSGDGQAAGSGDGQAARPGDGQAARPGDGRAARPDCQRGEERRGCE